MKKYVFYSENTVYNIFAWVAIGFGYQAVCYGAADWSSTLLWGHVLGWPVFFTVWVWNATRGAVAYLSFWALVAGIAFLVLCLLGGIGQMIDNSVWAARRRGRRSVARMERLRNKI